MSSAIEPLKKVLAELLLQQGSLPPRQFASLA